MLRAFFRLLRRVCFSRRVLKIACLLLLVAGATVFISDRAMVNASQQLTWSDVNAVPVRNVGLLLGAKPGNRYFTRRIDSAAELYHAGKVKWLLVSGDNGRKITMKRQECSGRSSLKAYRRKSSSAIMPDSQRLIQWCAPIKCLVRTISPLFRKNFITNAPSGWQNSTASMLSVLMPLT